MRLTFTWGYFEEFASIAYICPIHDFKMTTDKTKLSLKRYSLPEGLHRYLRLRPWRPANALSTESARPQSRTTSIDTDVGTFVQKKGGKAIVPCDSHQIALVNGWYVLLGMVNNDLCGYVSQIVWLTTGMCHRLETCGVALATAFLSALLLSFQQGCLSEAACQR